MNNTPNAAFWGASPEQAAQELGIAAARNAPQAVYQVALTGSDYGRDGTSLHTALYENRTLCFHTDFNTAAILYFMTALRCLCLPKVMEKEDRPRKITIYVASPGGLVDDGLFMFDTIKFVEEKTGEPVEIIIETQAASMGSLTSQVASPGHLCMTMGPHSNSTNMIHALSYGNQGKRDGHTRQSVHTRLAMGLLYQIYVDRILATFSEFHEKDVDDKVKTDVVDWLLRQMEARDTFMDPVACYENGLVDFIILDDASKDEYDKALAWYDGFWRLEPKKDGSGEYELRRQSRRIELSPEEKEQARQEVIRLQRQAYEKAKQIKSAREDAPIVHVLKALDDLRGDEGFGATSGIGEEEPQHYGQAAKLYVQYEDKRAGQ